MRQFTVAATHPSLEGHFPGRPIVPGVVLLDEILAIVAPGGAAALPVVRFVRPVRPGETVEVRGDAGRFEAWVGTELALRGSVVPR